MFNGLVVFSQLLHQHSLLFNQLNFLLQQRLGFISLFYAAVGFVLVLLD